MAALYQHVTGGILRDVAQRVGGLIWEAAKGSGEDGRGGLRNGPLRLRTQKARAGFPVRAFYLRRLRDSNS
jgi:hypothetical protein